MPGVKGQRRPQLAKIELAAAMRVLQRPWAEVAEAVELGFDAVTHWPSRYPEEWSAAIRRALNRVLPEAAAEALHTLRAELRGGEAQDRISAGRSIMQADAARLPHELRHSGADGGPVRLAVKLTWGTPHFDESAEEQDGDSDEEEGRTHMEAEGAAGG